MTIQKSWLVVAASYMAMLVALLFLAIPSRAQNLQLDLSSKSGLCGGQQCFNVAGLFTTGTKFLGTTGMDNGNNCTPTAPYTNCPDAYSSTQLGLSSTNPPTLTPASLGLPFTFGTVNTTSCGPSTSSVCIQDVVNYTTSGVVITLAPADQTIYSTMILLGTAVNGSHSASITATYTDSTTNVFTQTLSDWCGFGGNSHESIAVGGINRINADGTLNGANCNLYAYTLPLDYTRNLQSITLTDLDGSGDSFATAVTLKPPSYTIDGGTAHPTSVAPGASATATVTVNPQPGYSGTIALTCTISPSIGTTFATTAPTCTLNPNSVTVTTTESSAPTTSLTFTASTPAQSQLHQRRNIFYYAFWLVPGLALTGLPFGSRKVRRKWLPGLLLAVLFYAILSSSGCVSSKQLGNVGTPPGQYTVTITGMDEKGLTQASNPSGTSNTVVLTVTQ